MKLEERLIGTTASLVLREGHWLTDGLDRATRCFIAAPKDKDRFDDLLSWRRLAFRLFPSEIEAFSSANRDLCLLAAATGSLNTALPRNLTENHAWRRLAMNQRFSTAIDGALALNGPTRTIEEKRDLSDLLGKLRPIRRRMAHPKVLPDLYPEERDCEVLRRAMIAVLTQQRRIVESVLPDSDTNLPEDDPVTWDRPLRGIQLLHPAADWDADFYDGIERSSSQTNNLVHITLTELGKDSLWIMTQASNLDDSLNRRGSAACSMRGRPLAVTFFAEIEGTCAILSRAVLYAHSRGEIRLGDDELEWIECVCGERSAKQARKATRSSLDLAIQIQRTLTLYERASEHSLADLLEAPGWGSTANAIQLRDQIHHPRGVQGLLPSLEDTLNLLDAMQWFRMVRDQVTVGWHDTPSRR